MIHRRSFSRVLAAVLLCSAGLAASAQSLTVSAAASLSNVLKDLGARYEATRPGVKLQFNFAASGVLIQQIAQGAPVDLFISADEETMARGLEQKLLEPASRRDIASNQVVLITPAAGGVALRSLADLTGPAVQRIAVGKLATVPVGRYTKQSLEAAKLWTVLEPRLVHADSVRQVLDYVARGEVEAGFVYSTDAAVMPDKVRTVMRVDGHAPVRYPAAITTEGRQKAAAGEFLAFLLSPPAQAVLGQAGFGKP
ncbi:molybdate transport system substrate-binding protein [Sphaerotilus hippei]|uniref:Molybdate transport system substrate-binding protein n=1 Tax=Sphaerotilus hippei TaxID=744406 RepID=A0A318GZR2_9BURK|nr:molybdate ABC transporter substrate-binding protein [Sphaerotilus hippei]PXW94316.1 molybdate transport system substrate-binding protein [Sphaerotilus hippei]